MTVKIDRTNCIACGMCMQTCPTVFEMASDGMARVMHQPDEGEVETARMAAESCPVSVIQIED